MIYMIPAMFFSVGYIWKKVVFIYKVVFIIEDMSAKSEFCKHDRILDF